MNLIEALKTGQNIKLPEWEQYKHPSRIGFFSDNDVLRTDWQVYSPVKKKVWLCEYVYKEGKDWILSEFLTREDKFLATEERKIVRKVMEVEVDE